MTAQSEPISARHYFAFALCCAIWGSTWLAIRVVVRDIPPFRAAAIRFVIAAAILLVVAVAQKLPLPANRHEWRVIAILGITMMALPYGLLFWAEQHITSSVTAVLYSSLPLCVALLTPAITGKPVPRAAIYSMLVAIGGIAMLFQVDLRASVRTLLGGTAVLVAVVASSFSYIYAKQLASNIHPVVATGLQLIIGAAFLGVASVIMERNEPSRWTQSSLAALIFLATFGSAIAFAVFYWLLRHMHAYQLSTINLITPLVAIAVGALILHEFITPMMLLAAAVVLGAVGFVIKAESDEPAQLNLVRPTPPESQ
jgi:drug/metabolite transporter (DMT)-like permease